MARGRWLKKVGNRIKTRFDDAKDAVQDVVADGVDIGDLAPAIKGIKDRGSECHQVARDTMELCNKTKKKSDQMVAFGSEIQSSLQRFGSSPMDASSLEIIRDLTDGNKLREAMDIAKDMDVIALECVDKSILMLDLMEDSMDALPDRLEKWIDQAADKQKDDKSDEEAMVSLKSLDQDIDDVKACIAAIQDLNIATAFQIGLRAFEQLSGKAQKCRAMFESIQGYSITVKDITNNFQKFDVVSLASKINDILRCIRLSELMRLLAEGTKKIIQVLIDLFKATADRISTLWAALAFAKDCMANCVAHVVKAKETVLEAFGKSRLLLDKSESVMGQLRAVGKINKETYNAVRDLIQGEEISDAIKLARGMDDLVMDCTSNVVSMVERVTEGFQNLPDIITEGFDMEEAGKDDGDPQPRCVEDDINELEASRELMEKADIFTACRSGVASFSSVSKTTELCTGMLTNIEGFATNCQRTIDSFMGVWDLESAMDKIKEMCRLASIGKLMREFADQIKRLLLAIIALMKSAKDKLSNLDFKDLGNVDACCNAMGEAVGDVVGDVAEAAMDKITGRISSIFKK